MVSTLTNPLSPIVDSYDATYKAVKSGIWNNKIVE